MTARNISYEDLFAATPSPCLVLTPDLVIVEVNQAYTENIGRTRDELIGQSMFDAFPCGGPDSDGWERSMRSLQSSVRRASLTGRRDVQGPMQHDIPVKDRPGEFEERYWSTVTSPVLGPDGDAVLFVARSEDVTQFVMHRRRDRSRRADDPADADAFQAAELFSRASELYELNEELRRAYARERKVALSLQQAMLPAATVGSRADVAVRYLPAVDSLNVCGDWYDLVDVSETRLAVAVGDVVGHGLAAAGVMGQLRSALSAGIQVVGEPAQALQALGWYARSIDGALASTAVQVVIDRARQTITYSCAGHLPPVLLQPDGTAHFLDQATDPPLGVRFADAPRPQADMPYEPGATLVLYTDGLVERRGEDIDDGLRRLTEGLRRHARLDPEPLAEALLADLGVAGGAADDTALVINRLRAPDTERTGTG
jgi:serine phosphatase RsbU (regulator of sigma subunit)